MFLDFGCGGVPGTVNVLFDELITRRGLSPHLAKRSGQLTEMETSVGTKYVHTNLVAHDWKRLATFYIEVFGCKPKPPERDP